MDDPPLQRSRGLPHSSHWGAFFFWIRGNPGRGAVPAIEIGARGFVNTDPVAARVGRIGTLRDDAFERHCARLLMKFSAADDLVIAIVWG